MSFFGPTLQDLPPQEPLWTWQTPTISPSGQAELVRRYRDALRDWARPEIQEAASVLGLSQRQYCDHHIFLAGPIVWTSSGTLEGLDHDAAFLAALAEDFQ